MTIHRDAILEFPVLPGEPSVIMFAFKEKKHLVLQKEAFVPSSIAMIYF